MTLVMTGQRMDVMSAKPTGRKRRTPKLTQNSTIREVVEVYYKSRDYLSLTAKAQKEYYSCLNAALNTDLLNGRTMGETRIRHFKLRHATTAYDTWLVRGIRRANDIATIVSVVLNWAMYRELITYNPLRGVKRVANKPRKVMWTPEQVNAFLDMAYSKWRWRSIGLIVQMSYEWGQRLGDMRTLTWDALDLDAQRMDLTQSKRGTDVHMPISDPLVYVLKQQHETYGFQPYVAPNVRASDGAYKPYALDSLSVYINEVKRAAGLPDELTAMDMRRTAITEMVEAGVDITQIKQVTGHTSLSSLTPYIKHTYAGAANALAMRQAYKDGKDDSDD